MVLYNMLPIGNGIKHLEEYLMELDSKFQFECCQCGKCCIHQDTIIFNARDIYNIAKKKSMTMQAVVEAYTETYIDRNSRIPIIHLLSNGPKGTCPLLVDGRCSVHDCKPIACALYPLSRIVIGKESIEDTNELLVKYVLNKHDCGSTKQVNTVRSWLAKFGMPEHDEFYLLWSKVLMDLTQAVRKLEDDQMPDTILNTYWNAIYQVLYLDYDTNQEFMPQFQAAADKLLRLSEEIMKAQLPAGRSETKNGKPE